MSHVIPPPRSGLWAFSGRGGYSRQRGWLTSRKHSRAVTHPNSQQSGRCVHDLLKIRGQSPSPSCGTNYFRSEDEEEGAEEDEEKDSKLGGWEVRAEGVSSGRQRRDVTKIHRMKFSNFLIKFYF